jgi:hypothetical protein
MKKLFLSVIGLYIGILAAFSQSNQQADTVYKKRKLTYDEANFVSSYYSQNGNNAAVTGGIGSEKLTDLSNSFDIKFIGYDKRNRKHSVTGEVGIDHYTSASSDMVDLKANTSASYSDLRIYPSVNWTMENEKKKISFGGGLSYSHEFDYQSFGANLNFSKKTNDASGEFFMKLQAYMDAVSLVYPIEFRTGNQNQGDDEHNYPSTPRNSYSGSITWSQIINKRFQIMLDGEFVYQKGYLGLPFHRVFFTDNSVHVEKLPSTRMKIPLGLRANYFIGDKFILRTWYRHYHDDWNINSDAVQVETVVKVTPFFSVTPFYRFYRQSAASYFAPYRVHTAGDAFYTSNYDLAEFNSNFYGAGFRIAPPNGVFKIQRINALELRYGHYQKTTGMNSNIISLHLKFK